MNNKAAPSHRLYACITCLLTLLFLSPFFQVILTQKPAGIRSAQYLIFVALSLLLLKQRQHFSFQQSIPRAYLLIVWLSALFLMCGSVISKFLAVELNGVDFSIFDWMLANSYQGSFMYSPIYELNHLGVHPSWIMLALVPFHFLLPSPYLLLLVGSGALWLASYPLWLLCKDHKLPDSEAALVVLAYLLTPFVGVVLADGFRIESLFPLFTFSFLLFWQREAMAKWLLWALLLLSVKEDAAFYLVGFSCSFMVLGKKRQAALALLTLCLGVGYLNLAIVQPYFLADKGIEPAYLKFWSHFGASKYEIIKNMLTSPLDVIKQLLASGWWKVYAPLLFLPLLHLPTLFASLPGLLLLGTAASYPAMHQYGHYYPLLLVCFALFGMVLLRSRCQSLSPLPWRFALAIFPLFHAGWIKLSLPDWQSLDQLAQAKEFIGKHYPEAPVCVQTIAFPHLGYNLAIEALSPKCLAKEDALYLIVLNKSPYPFSRPYLEQLSQTPPLPRKLHQFGSVHLLSPLK